MFHRQGRRRPAARGVIPPLHQPRGHVPAHIQEAWFGAGLRGHGVRGLPVPDIRPRHNGINALGDHEPRCGHQNLWPQQLQGRYRALKPLGEGVDAKTWLAQPHVGGRKLVCVQVGKGQRGRQHTRHEIQVLSILTRPQNIVAFLDMDRQHFSWTVMPYYPGGLLSTHIERNPGGQRPETVWNLLGQFVGAVESLHSNRPPVAHGDLHAGNLILKDGDPNNRGFRDLRIIDFGRAAVANRDNPEMQMAPFEVSALSDIWSIATIFHCLAHGTGLHGRNDPSLARDGRCICGNWRPGLDFSNLDLDYRRSMDILCGGQIGRLVGPAAATLMQIARRCRDRG